MRDTVHVGTRVIGFGAECLLHCMHMQVYFRNRVYAGSPAANRRRHQRGAKAHQCLENKGVTQVALTSAAVAEGRYPKVAFSAPAPPPKV